MRGWVQSSSELLRELWWKCATSAECKTDRSAVLMVKSVLDPHMINELKDEFNIDFQLFLWPYWVPTISVLILAYVVKRRTPEWSTSWTTRSSEDAINQSDACGRWRWIHIFIVIDVRVKTFMSTLVSVIKVNKPFLHIFRIVLWYYTHESTICVKLWSWHTYELRSVFFGKTGVTEWYQSNANCRTQPQIEMIEINDSFSRKPFQHPKYLIRLKNIFYSLFFIKIISICFILHWDRFLFLHFELPPVFSRIAS
jgi:hypothetical protein